MNSTTVTMQAIDMPTAVFNASPNPKHPIFAENPERTQGVMAALVYLAKRDFMVLDEFEDPKEPLFLLSLEEPYDKAV